MPTACLWSFSRARSRCPFPHTWRYYFLYVFVFFGRKTSCFTLTVLPVYPNFLVRIKCIGLVPSAEFLCVCSFRGDPVIYQIDIAAPHKYTQSEAIHFFIVEPSSFFERETWPIIIKFAKQAIVFWAWTPAMEPPPNLTDDMYGEYAARRAPRHGSFSPEREQYHLQHPNDVSFCHKWNLSSPLGFSCIKVPACWELWSTMSTHANAHHRTWAKFCTVWLEQTKVLITKVMWVTKKKKNIGSNRVFFLDFPTLVQLLFGGCSDTAEVEDGADFRSPS